MKRFLLTMLAVTMFITTLRAQFDDKFYYPGKTWKPVVGVTFEEVALDTDTVKLSAIFLKPAGIPKATILFFHGAGGNVTNYLNITKPLADHGYQVFMIDFRGYGKSTGRPTHLNVAKDGQFVLDYMLGRKDVVKTSVILFGASLGTQVATKLARDNQNRVHGLVFEGAMASFTDIALQYAPKEQHDMIRQYLVSPYAAKEDIRFIDAMPKLIVHGKEDREVPIVGGESVFANAKGPKEFWVCGGSHLEAMQVSPAEYLRKIDQLLVK